MQSESTFEQIFNAAAATSSIEWLAFVLSLSYVYLAAKENPWCWPVGLGSVVLTFIIYIKPEVRLYSEATLQIYYMAMSVYGWIVWTKSKGAQKGDNVASISFSSWSFRQHLLALITGVGLLFLLGYFWSLMGAALPYVDAFTTSFSIIATYMVTQKIIENWLYWIVIDVVSIFMNWDRGLYLFAILFVIYCIVAVYGWFAWRRGLLKTNQ